MKIEQELNSKTKTELSVKQKKEVKHELQGRIIPYENHTMQEVNNETKEIKKALFSNVTYEFGGELRKEVITKKGHSYIGALNKRNVLKKFDKGVNGSKPITDNPIEL